MNGWDSVYIQLFFTLCANINPSPGLLQPMYLSSDLSFPSISVAFLKFLFLYQSNPFCWQLVKMQPVTTEKQWYGTVRINGICQLSPLKCDELSELPTFTQLWLTWKDFCQVSGLALLASLQNQGLSMEDGSNLGKWFPQPTYMLEDALCQCPP